MSRRPLSADLRAVENEWRAQDDAEQKRLERACYDAKSAHENDAAQDALAAFFKRVST